MANKCFCYLKAVGIDPQTTKDLSHFEDELLWIYAESFLLLGSAKSQWSEISEKLSMIRHLPGLATKHQMGKRRSFYACLVPYLKSVPAVTISSPEFKLSSDFRVVGFTSRPPTLKVSYGTRKLRVGFELATSCFSRDIKAYEGRMPDRRNNRHRIKLLKSLTDDMFVPSIVPTSRYVEIPRSKQALLFRLDLLTAIQHDPIAAIVIDSNWQKALDLIFKSVLQVSCLLVKRLKTTDLVHESKSSQLVTQNLLNSIKLREGE